MALRIRAAAHYQRRDDPVRMIIDETMPRLAGTFRTALRSFREGLDLKAIADSAAAADLRGVLNACNLDQATEALRTACEPMRQAFIKAACLGADQIRQAQANTYRIRKDMQADDGTTDPNDPYAFSLSDPRVDAAILALILLLTTEIHDEARQVVITIIMAGLTDGDAPIEIARTVSEQIGLNAKQRVAVQNYRAALESRSKMALQRALRDPQYDRLVQEIIDGAPIDPAMIDKMVQAYAERTIAHRADTIARTEAVRASNQGLHEAYLQAVRSGVFPEASVRRFWQTALDEGVCPICEAIPDKNETGVAVDDPFDTDIGPVDNPPVHVSCRCSVRVRTDLDMVVADRIREAA